jgi:futalosine hydrolase
LGPNAIIIPTALEAGILIENISEQEQFYLQGKRISKGLISGTPVILCLCGVGKANAAHCAALLFANFRPSSVFVLGVAGAYPSSGLSIGDIVIGEREFYGDEGLLTDTGIRTMDALGLPLAEAESGNYYNEFPLFVPDELKDHKKRGTFVTVSACSGTAKRGCELEKRFNALCENMEGAAVAHVGVLNGVGVAEIRGISNVIEDREGRPLDKAALILAAENVQRFFLEKIMHVK